MNAGTRNIERKFADGNAHAIRAKIAETQNSLAVGHDDKLYRVCPISQQLGNASTIVCTNKQTPRPLKNIAKSLTGEPYRRGVNERLNFIDIVANDTEEQSLITIVQSVERDIFV
jgi:hypothetical protein